MALAATLLASGCSSERGAATDQAGARAPISQTPDAPAADPAGSSGISQPAPRDHQRRLTEADFEFAVPDDWSAYSLHRDGQVTPLADAGELRLDLQPTAIASGLQGARLFAVSSLVDAVPATLTIIGLGGEPELADGSTGQISDELVAHLAGLDITDVEVRTTRVAGLAAAEATYRQADPSGDTRRDRRGVTVFVPRESGSWILTISAPATIALDALADQIVASFQPR